MHGVGRAGSPTAKCRSCLGLEQQAHMRLACWPFGFLEEAPIAEHQEFPLALLLRSVLGSLGF